MAISDRDILPATMKAMILPKFGDSDGFEMREVERPSPRPGEVLIRIAGTSVNPADVNARAGALPNMFPASKLPLLLGFDASGTIVEVGEGVSDWHIGDRVFGFPGTERGSFAEYIPLNATEVASAPQSVSLADAGAVPLAAMAAWHGLVTQGKLQPGQRVLIQGGSGGVGHFAVQFANLIGATVFATASGHNKHFLIELGADVAIDYETQRVEDGAPGMDLVLDLVGAKTEASSWSVMTPHGKLVMAAGEPNTALARWPSQTGDFALAKSTRNDLERVARWIDDGKVHLTISDRFHLEDVGHAQARLERGGVRGKISVEVSAQ